jgi:ketopantoate hydroxymethyltransferase
MAHVGLTPQAINTIGSFRAQGRDEADWARIEEDTVAVAQAGAFSVVIEAVAEPLARKLTAAVVIPTIGIGASVACDGQILCLRTCSAFRRAFRNSSSATARSVPALKGRSPTTLRSPRAHFSRAGTRLSDESKKA